MKNLKTPMALAILLAAAPAVNAADLTITGEIKDTSCKATVNGGVAVTMHKVDLEDLKTSNRVGRTALDVVVDCTGASGSQDVAVKFTGATTPDGALALNGSSDAEGVAYKFYDVNDQPLAINGTPTEFVKVDASAPQILHHSVWYAKTGAAADVVAGQAIANAQMDIIYK